MKPNLRVYIFLVFSAVVAVVGSLLWYVNTPQPSDQDRQAQDQKSRQEQAAEHEAWEDKQLRSGLTRRALEQQEAQRIADALDHHEQYIPSKAWKEEYGGQPANDRRAAAKDDALYGYCQSRYRDAWADEMMKIAATDKGLPTGNAFYQMTGYQDGIALRLSYGVENRLKEWKFLNEGEDIKSVPGFAAMDKLATERGETDAHKSWETANIHTESDWADAAPSDGEVSMVCVELGKEASSQN